MTKCVKKICSRSTNFTRKTDNIVLWKCGNVHKSVEISSFFWYLFCLTWIIHELR
jgi:hypothetical protein